MEYDVPLELNASKVAIAMKENKPKEWISFPLDYFWEEASKAKVKVVIGLDSHEVRYVEKKMFEYGLNYAKKYDLDVLDAEQILRRMKKIKSHLR